MASGLVVQNIDGQKPTLRLGDILPFPSDTPFGQQNRTDFYVDEKTTEKVNSHSADKHQEWFYRALALRRMFEFMDLAINIEDKPPFFLTVPSIREYILSNRIPLPKLIPVTEHMTFKPEIQPEQKL